MLNKDEEYPHFPCSYNSFYGPTLDICIEYDFAAIYSNNFLFLFFLSFLIITPARENKTFFAWFSIRDAELTSSFGWTGNNRKSGRLSHISFLQYSQSLCHDCISRERNHHFTVIVFFKFRKNGCLLVISCKV